jgi:hypothetical protein
VVFGGSSSNNVLVVQSVNGTTPATLTIGPGITVHGGQGGTLSYFYGNEQLVNQGTISADTAGKLIDVVMGPLTNQGTLQASAGTLTIGGTWSNSGTLAAQLSASNDYFIVSNAALGGALTLSVASGFTPHLGDRFTIIRNQGSNPVAGTFTGLLEGSLVWAGTYGFTISYAGGDGNDVVLTVAAVQAKPTVTATWSGWTYDGTAHPAGGAATGVNGENLGTPTSFTYYAGTGTGGTNFGAIAPTDAGTYTVVAHYAGSEHYLAADSDSLTVVVAKAALTVTVNNAWRFVGDANPTFSGTVIGIVNNDDVTVAYGTSAAANSSAGNYDINATMGGSKLGEYAVTVSKGTLAVITPASCMGFVFEDFNDDGQIDFGEKGISAVTIRLQGTDDVGRTIDVTTTTDGSGAYQFGRLRQGTYTITASQPAGYTQGISTVGSAGGSVSGNVFTVQLGAGIDGMNYNFGERPANGGPVTSGQTAQVGFWNNKSGQALIKALNGGATSTQLGNWLATTFKNMFGANAGGNNLAGKTNAEVATIFQQKFVVKGQKLDAQVMATALSVYVTNQTLAGTVAAAYGFKVTQDGVGIATFNVGNDGAAVGKGNGTTMNVLDVLLATDALSANSNGNLYGGNATERNAATDLYGAINLAGSV